MGYTLEELTVNVRLSRHNSLKDEEHNALWDDLRRRVIEITDEPKYADIEPAII